VPEAGAPTAVLTAEVNGGTAAMSEDTSTSSGGPSAPAPYPGWQTPQQTVPQPELPSRVPTVLITIFFGAFGAIPAHLHGKRAEQLGGSSTPYWKAFGVTLAASVLAWIALIVALVVFVFAVGSSVDDGLPTSVRAQAAQPAPVDPGAQPGGQVGGPWTAATIEPYLDEFADDEAADWAMFSRDLNVIIPCGGQQALGAAPDLLESTSGGRDLAASAEILPDAGSAAREMDRLRTLVAGCGPHDVVGGDGTVLTSCDSPVVASVGEVIRFEETCDLDPGVAYAWAFFSADNAVVAMTEASADELDGAVAAMRSTLGAD
jgi:hypothetical protein